MGSMPEMPEVTTMTHPGLPLIWALVVAFAMTVIIVRVFFGGAKSANTGDVQPWHFNLANLPIPGRVIGYVTSNPGVLQIFKIAIVAIFLTLIWSGLTGTPVPERNAATVITWNIWWSGLIVSIFFFGSAWCAICPWDTLATWMVRFKAGKLRLENSLGLRVPRALRNVWPALILLIGLTWAELGGGITSAPYATAVLALMMVVMATVSMALFERKAFCRYFCPVGRTVGAYSSLAPIELRPADPEICATCTSLECYHGTDEIAPCPTHLVMGRLKQNTYCTSCGNCARSCPDSNVAWRLRLPGAEAGATARPHVDEAWFMLGLLALTGFHGLTMMTFWEDWLFGFARLIGDSGRLLMSFSVGLVISLTIPAGFYALSIWIATRLGPRSTSFRAHFIKFSFTALPLAFAYHLAHNLGHLVREGKGIGAVLVNPTGAGTLPMSANEKHMRAMELAMPQDLLFALQAGLMIFGFWIATRVIVARVQQSVGNKTSQDGSAWFPLPMVLFAAGVTAFHMWLLMQPMTMRV